jgi:hypothetical protein
MKRDVSGSVHRTRWITAGLLLLPAGCQTDQPPAERYRDMALQSAYEIGQVELSCPDAMPRITSGEAVQPPDGTQAIQVPQLEYTVDVAGCGATRTYLIVCREDGSGCAPTAQ